MCYYNHASRFSDTKGVVIMRTAHDYLNAHPNAPDYVVNCLAQVEAALAGEGTDWYSVSLEQWPRVYSRLRILNSAVCNKYHSSLLFFYDWLDETGELPKVRASYSMFRPVLGQNVEVSAASRFLPTLDAMLDLIHRSFSGQRRWPEFVIEEYQLICSFLWLQLNVPDITQLTPECFAFSDEVQTKVSLTERILPSICSVTLKRDKAGDITIRNRTLVPMLCRYLLNRQVGAPLFTQSSGHSYTPAILTARLHKFFAKLNKSAEMDLSIRSVQLSGLYFRVYRQWESSDIPYVYTRDTSDRLIEWLGLPPSSVESVRLNEYYKFLAYVRDVQGKAL